MNRPRRRMRRKLASIPEISLTPLIDTALTLLVIFMVTSPMIHNAIKVQLPKGNAKEDAGLAQDITVYIDKDNRFFVNGASVASHQLVDTLKKMVSASQKTVYVKADERVSYGLVIDAVDNIKVLGGIEYVALATQKRA